MRIPEVDPGEARSRLEWASYGLAREHPELSAAHPTDRRQRRVFLGIAVATIVSLAVMPIVTLTFLVDRKSVV